MIIAIERPSGKEYMLNPSATTTFQTDDVVWFVSPDELTVSRFEKR